MRRSQAQNLDRVTFHAEARIVGREFQIGLMGKLGPDRRRELRAALIRSGGQPGFRTRQVAQRIDLEHLPLNLSGFIPAPELARGNRHDAERRHVGAVGIQSTAGVFSRFAETPIDQMSFGDRRRGRRPIVGRPRGPAQRLARRIQPAEFPERRPEHKVGRGMIGVDGERFLCPGQGLLVIQATVVKLGDATHRHRIEWGGLHAFAVGVERSVVVSQQFLLPTQLTGSCRRRAGFLRRRHHRARKSLFGLAGLIPQGLVS